MRNKIIPYNPELRALARQLRKNSTLPEILLWQNIKNRTLGFQFHRQVPMLNYIVDFYCHEIGLAIEIDGRSHDHSFLYDAKRQHELEKYGVRFLRISNEEIMKNMFSVLLVIEEKIKEIQTPL
ncbi:endonuclease domain-containing protein [Aestuariibaculum sediminum]|uniref:Endonuclease domain-containing protein n=1 Tax=Aestuariibaculum sediminum TaxID=2770637 RepID=A0A8J6Q9D4_9FLAO|nr:endonuclease domain-containing protein [Aestuariibaculum sediminum]MBD0833510.1 endonuclease domain-containing protein [Aestuariibaculum sediminum]